MGLISNNMNYVAPCLLLFMGAIFVRHDSLAQAVADQVERTSDFYDNYNDYHDDYPLPGKDDAQKEDAPETAPSSRFPDAGAKSNFIDMVDNVLVWQAVLGISVVLLLILLAVRMLSAPAKTFRIESGGGQQSGILMGVQPLSENASLYFVYVGAKVLVVGVTAQQISLVETLTLSEFLEYRPGLQTLNSAAEKELEHSAVLTSMNPELSDLRKDMLDLQRSIDELRNQMS